jgi:hypothetical protein
MGDEVRSGIIICNHTIAPARAATASVRRDTARAFSFYLVFAGR